MMKVMKKERRDFLYNGNNSCGDDGNDDDDDDKDDYGVGWTSCH